MVKVTSLRISQQLVGDPLSMWRQYARDHPGTVHRYDFGAPGNPDVLTGTEAWRSRIINSRLTRSQCTEVVQRAVCAPWTDVPAGADLVDADPSEPGGLFAGAARLYWSFFRPQRISGVAVAKIHKILHPKRPGLYPILDARVKSLTGRTLRRGQAAWVTWEA